MCGQLVAVPALSSLRQLAGQQKFEIHIVDRIRQMASEGRLPEGQSCLQCGAETRNVSDLILECQRPWMRSDGYWKTMFLMLVAVVLGPIWIVMHIVEGYRNPELIGSELVLHAPLRLCPECSSKVGKRQGKLRRVLRKVPAYNELLREYPTARIHVPRR